MRRSIVRRIQNSLTEKRENLTEWLEDSPTAQKEIPLGGLAEQDVKAHLEVIETTMNKSETETFGVCEICQGNVNTSLLEMDYTATVCLDCLSEDERRQLEIDLELSQAVQRALMPQQAPVIPGLEVAAFSRPAQIVGGDYFDFIKCDDDTYGLTIADAMGHGLSASMMMTSLQATLRTLLPESESPGAVLERINHFYLHNVNYTTFVTLFLGKFDPLQHTLTYFNAGHNPPVLVRSTSKEIIWLHPCGSAIGINEEYKILPRKVQLAPGDVLVLYTDGVTEAINKDRQEFGDQRLAALVSRNAGLPVAEIVSLLRQELANHTEGQRLADDTTIVVCKVTK